MKLMLLLGATGVGKTQRATAIARAFDIPVVVLDRIQSYHDLVLLSGRPSIEELYGTQRIYLADRISCAGDWSADDAYRQLREHLQHLATQHSYTILEGGSLSLWQKITADGLSNYELHTTIFCTFSDPAAYRERVARRVHTMIEAGLWDEVHTLCKCPTSQTFASTILGFDVMRDVSFADRFNPSVINAIVDEHYQYALHQRTFFNDTVVPWLYQRNEVHIHA